jgi:predicted metal-dependent RNase
LSKNVKIRICKTIILPVVAVGADMAELLAVVALRKASLSSVCLYLDGNIVKAIQFEYPLGFNVSC